MKKREILDFSSALMSELIKYGFVTQIEESRKSNSVYISDIKNRFVVRISDHGEYYADYNFTPRKRGNTRIKNGQLFFSMDENGISEFINVINSSINNIKLDDNEKQ